MARDAPIGISASNDPNNDHQQCSNLVEASQGDLGLEHGPLRECASNDATNNEIEQHGNKHINNLYNA
jgi:hypothetical protein